MVAVVFNITLTTWLGAICRKICHIRQEHDMIRREHGMTQLSDLDHENAVYDTA